MLLLLLIVVLFALWMTIHVWLSMSLLRQTPRWRAALALLIPVLAPYWCLINGWRIRALVWCLFALAYGISLSVAYL
jgi:hypothetical protein